MKEKFGFLRETTEDAIKAGIDNETGLHRTGLDEYLKIIFPNVTDWIHDKPLGRLDDGSFCRKRPDYRSEKLKLIIEFDGIQHYQSVKQIIKDYENTNLYENLGYKVVRIPYFIQLTNEAVEYLFNKKVKRKLFNGNIPSLHIGSGPADICTAGIQRMALEFLQFPEQLQVNLNYLYSLDDDYLTGASLLDKEIQSIIFQHTIDFNYLFTDTFKDELSLLYKLSENKINTNPLLSTNEFYGTIFKDNFDDKYIYNKLLNIFKEAFIQKCNNQKQKYKN